VITILTVCIQSSVPRATLAFLVRDLWSLDAALAAVP
jgi:hypothetical protein